jgi:hypothetical protein
MRWPRRLSAWVGSLRVMAALSIGGTHMSLEEMLEQNKNNDYTWLISDSRVPMTHRQPNEEIQRKSAFSPVAAAGRCCLYVLQRLIASARAGSFLGCFRRGVRFAARAIDQDGVLLLMPREPSLSFYWVPLAILSVVGGALIGALT